MTLYVPRLPFSLDPLIAEARRRARRRGLVVLLLVLLLGVATGVIFALPPSGGPSGAGSGGEPGVRFSANAPRIEVPLDATEVRWRSAVRGGAVELPQPLAALGSTTQRPHHHRLAVRRRAVAAAVSASGARLVRLRVWRTSSPPPVELVVKIDSSPAAYLRHDVLALLDTIAGNDAYLKVVDTRGARILEWATLPGNWTTIVPPALRACSPLQGDLAVINQRPCPAS